MKSEFNKAKLSEQIQALIDGSISREEFESLQQTLAGDLEAQECYLAQMEVESMLEEHFSVEGEDFKVTLPSRMDGNSKTAISYRRIFLAVSACLAVILSMGNWLLIPEPVQAIRVEIEKELPASQVLRQSVARLTNGEGFQLTSSGWAPPLGARLAAGNYQLSEGSIELTFDAGTKIFMSAPTSFGIVDFDEIHLRSGNLEADVPEQAIGFRVQTPAGKIVDFSTRFAVTVDESGASDIHVIEGLVEATPNLVDQQPIPLIENSSLRMIPDAFPEQVDFVPSKSVEFSKGNIDTEFSYLHFSFDQDLAGGNVENHGTSGDGEGGQLVSEEKDAWLQVAGKVGKAVFFSGKAAEIKTNVKGISGDRPRTIAFWTRIMPQTHGRHSHSFMGWGTPGDADGGTWQMGWNSNYNGDEGVEGAIRTEFGGGYVIGSTDLRDGKWHHVTSVFVGGNGSVVQQVRHYVDGKLEAISGYEDQKINTDANQEALTVGKYIFNGSPFYGSFKGWLDEMYLFDVALTPDQIVEIMNNNRVPEANEIVPFKEDKN